MFYSSRAMNFSSFVLFDLLHTFFLFFVFAPVIKYTTFFQNTAVILTICSFSKQWMDSLNLYDNWNLPIYGLAMKFPFFYSFSQYCINLNTRKTLMQLKSLSTLAYENMLLFDYILTTYNDCLYLPSLVSTQLCLSNLYTNIHRRVLT